MQCKSGKTKVQTCGSKRVPQAFHGLAQGCVVPTYVNLPRKTTLDSVLHRLFMFYFLVFTYFLFWDQAPPPARTGAKKATNESQMQVNKHWKIILHYCMAIITER